MPNTADWRDAAPPALVAAVDAAFPDRAVADVTGTGPSWNDQNVTAEVTFADGDTAFLKAALDGDGTRVAREHAVTNFLRDRSPVAVPEVLAAAPAGDPPYLATAPLGDHSLRVDWRDADEPREPLAESLEAEMERRLDAIR
jgi:hypothetical protein